MTCAEFRPGGECHRLLMRVEQLDEAPCEVWCQVSDTTAMIFYPLETEQVEETLARYLNLFPVEHRMKLVRARADHQAEYLIGGDTEIGLIVKELAVPTLA